MRSILHFSPIREAAIYARKDLQSQKGPNVCPNRKTKVKPSESLASKHFVHVNATTATSFSLLHRHGRLIRRQELTVCHLSVEIDVENQEIEMPSLKLTAKAPDKRTVGRPSILSFLGRGGLFSGAKWLDPKNSIDFACGSSF